MKDHCRTGRSERVDLTGIRLGNDWLLAAILKYDGAVVIGAHSGKSGGQDRRDTILVLTLELARFKSSPKLATIYAVITTTGG